MNKEKGPSQIKLFIGLTLSVFTLLVVRLAQLQIAQGPALAARAEEIRVRMVRTPAPRGVIYDRERRPLVTSRLAFSLVAVPEALTDPQAELDRVADILNLPAADLRKKLDNLNRRPHEGVVLAANLDQRAVLSLAEAEAELPGMMLQEMPVRYYPRGEFASHLFGYVGEITASQLAAKKEEGYRIGQVIGQDGLEKVFDRVLQGEEGGRLMEVDNKGVPRRNLGYRDYVPGNGLVLTIDADLQEAAEKALAEQLTRLRRDGSAPKADAGAVVALDPNTGEILALTSQPGFDPNLFVGGIKASDYNRLLTDPRRPFTNRVVSGEYPAGSSFKAVTAIAALSEGLTSPDDRFSCTGVDPVYPKKCWTVGSREPHGAQDIIAGIKNSCNIVFYELGRRVGPDKLAGYAREFGLGAPTGIDLPGERAGLVPTTEWKQRVYRDRWYFPETMDFAIGQGFLSMTPIQLAQVYMAISNGGTIYRPQLVREVVDPSGRVLERYAPKVSRRLELDEQALAVVRRGLAAVTGPGGTAYSAFKDMPIAVAGKTGTAENPHGPGHAWFVGYAPAEAPRIVLAVLVEHGASGGMAAAPVARRILDAFFGTAPAEAGDGATVEAMD